MIFQNKSDFHFSYPTSWDELKIHFLGCFDNSNFDLIFKKDKDIEIISIKSQEFGRHGNPLIPTSLKADLRYDGTSNLKETKLFGNLTINYLPIVGTMIVALTSIIIIFTTAEMNFSNIITVSIISILLIIYPLYRINQIKQYKDQLFELFDDVLESCKISNEEL